MYKVMIDDLTVSEVETLEEAKSIMSYRMESELHRYMVENDYPNTNLYCLLASRVAMFDKSPAKVGVVSICKKIFSITKKTSKG